MGPLAALSGRSQPPPVPALSCRAGTLKTTAAGIETRLFKGPNLLNRFVNVYLNDEDIRHLKNLETPVKAGDEISIVPAIAGGRE